MSISPLFAVEAEELLEDGKIQEAIDLCLEGLDAYPGYPTGEAVLAKAYKLIGDDEKANERIEKAVSRNPTLKSFNAVKNSTKEELIEQTKSRLKPKQTDSLESLSDESSNDSSDILPNDEFDSSDLNDFSEEKDDGNEPILDEDNTQDSKDKEEIEESSEDPNEALYDDDIDSLELRDFVDVEAEKIENKQESEDSENKIDLQPYIEELKDSELDDLESKLENSEEVPNGIRSNDFDMNEIDELERDLNEINDDSSEEDEVEVESFKDLDEDLAVPDFTGFEDETENAEESDLLEERKENTTELENITEDLSKDEDIIQEIETDDDIEIELSAFDPKIIPGLESQVKLLSYESYDLNSFFNPKYLEPFENTYTNKETLELPALNTEKDKNILEMSLKYIKDNKDDELLEIVEDIESDTDDDEIVPTIIRETKKNNIYTPTLASIYEAQGAAKDAINIYQKLIEQDPENEKKYKKKIKKLKK